jgi:hypothetical protein
MKFDEPAFLERLQLQPRDLSSARRFLDTGVESPAQSWPQLTRANSEIRGRVPDANAARWGLPQGSNSDVRSTALGQPKQAIATPSVVWVPVMPLSHDNFDVLQKFEGTVVSITNDSFIARLVDNTHGGLEEEAEIPLAEVTCGDRELVEPGAMFYWVIGYRREAYGQISRSSVIRFKRVPSWSDADIERAKKEAETFLSFLDLDKAKNPA